MEICVVLRFDMAVIVEFFYLFIYLGKSHNA